MEVTITLPNNFKNLTESERLTIISKEIESLQKQHSDIQSKWSKIAQRMRKKNLLSGTSEFVLTQSKHLRENFSFRHDRD